MFSVFFFPSASVCLPVFASISCWLVLEFSGGVHIPICVSNAYGASRERLQDRTVPALSPQGHVCVCVEGFLCRLLLCSVNFRGLKVVFSPRPSPMAAQYTTGIDFTKTNRTE